MGGRQHRLARLPAKAGFEAQLAIAVGRESLPNALVGGNCTAGTTLLRRTLNSLWKTPWRRDIDALGGPVRTPLLSSGPLGEDVGRILLLFALPLPFEPCAVSRFAAV